MSHVDTGAISVVSETLVSTFRPRHPSATLTGRLLIPIGQTQKTDRPSRNHYFQDQSLPTSASVPVTSISSYSLLSERFYVGPLDPSLTGKANFLFALVGGEEFGSLAAQLLRDYGLY